MIDSRIRNIIFDLGGVILNIDYSKTANAFINLGITNFNQLYTQLHASSLFEDLECGKISPEAFVNQLSEHSNVKLTTEQIYQAWNAMLLDFPSQRIELLKNLKSRYRIFLLSNTNAIHYEEISRIFKESYPEGKLEDCFEKSYYSHLIGYRKPNKEAFEYVLKENNLKPEETMFIDDTLPNTDAASLLGINSVYLHQNSEIHSLFA